MGKPENLLQGELLPVDRQGVRTAASGTFIPNMKLPVHRWFRYSAGFSAGWVSEVLAGRGEITVLDPFVGSGTVSVEADKFGLVSYGVEAHPFVHRLAKGKLSWDSDIEAFEHAVAKIRELTKRKSNVTSSAPDLLKKCYSSDVLGQLFALKRSFSEVASDFSETTASLVFLALTAVLRSTSHVGTAQWQYVLPNKKKVNVTSPGDALDAQVSMMVDDMRAMRRCVSDSRAILLRDDARILAEVPDNSIDLVVTSPPYANNYDYADATRLEMTFWGEIESWGELHEAVRKFLICSSSQHASKDKLLLDQILADQLVRPIRNELTEVCLELSKVRATKSGNKAYHTMIAAYFRDMSATFNALRRVMKSGGEMCLVVGDSAPYGIYAPVERWLGELSLAFGFKDWRFEKIRDRNVKWKNRKHRVPLKEGRLWIHG